MTRARELMAPPVGFRRLSLTGWGLFFLAVSASAPMTVLGRRHRRSAGHRGRRVRRFRSHRVYSEETKNPAINIPRGLERSA